ncbi:hypothetical protein SAMN05444920_11862 [Nonomuraea solani]|uniref:Uncharacterized protein n=1 Tax=Nonomuraea solani TaxID=1144553 RepID=A0A1H6ETZ0_9ACTN|nr:hypothetical protein SAMN05444920_11862 [Nonomuraea solani]
MRGEAAEPERRTSSSNIRYREGKPRSRPQRQSAPVRTVVNAALAPA